MLALAEGRPELLEPVIAGLPYRVRDRLRGREEMAQTLDDVLTRRTRAVIQRARAHHGGRRRPRPTSSHPSWAGTSEQTTGRPHAS